ncbi:Uncharacterized protein TCM_024966 [Theobroma cacao]|uniref:Uncharacterized protein n=1 Tax=Theobroma cacao TaxID=3641 RepID=A0A061EWS9_THECC|nr:Uncharacterized protein TCM_024966 [Theobroma cacao]
MFASTIYNIGHIKSIVHINFFLFSTSIFFFKAHCFKRFITFICYFFKKNYCISWTNFIQSFMYPINFVIVE